MNSQKFIELLKSKTYTIPSYLIQNYNELNITESELIVIIMLINSGDKIIYDLNNFMDELHIEKFKLMSIISSLEEKKIISIDLIKNNNGKSEEYINLELLYNKIMNIYLSNEQIEEKDDTNIYSIFENELGRPLSPMEYEIIKGWINDNFSSELIILALKEAVYNGVSNLRYIDKVLYEWRKKNIKSESDIIKDKEKFHRNKKENIPVFDYDWLDE